MTAKKVQPTLAPAEPDGVNEIVSSSLTLFAPVGTMTAVVPSAEPVCVMVKGLPVTAMPLTATATEQSEVERPATRTAPTLTILPRLGERATAATGDAPTLGEKQPTCISRSECILGRAISFSPKKAGQRNPMHHATQSASWELRSTGPQVGQVGSRLCCDEVVRSNTP